MKVGKCNVFYDRSAKLWETETPKTHYPIQPVKTKQEAQHLAALSKPKTGYDVIYTRPCVECQADAKWFVEYPHADKSAHNILNAPPAAVGELIHMMEHDELVCPRCLHVMKFEYDFGIGNYA